MKVKGFLSYLIIVANFLSIVAFFTFLCLFLWPVFFLKPMDYDVPRTKNEGWLRDEDDGPMKTYRGFIRDRWQG